MISAAAAVSGPRRRSLRAFTAPHPVCASQLRQMLPKSLPVSAGKQDPWPLRIALGSGARYDDLHRLCIVCAVRAVTCPVRLPARSEAVCSWVSFWVRLQGQPGWLAPPCLPRPPHRTGPRFRSGRSAPGAPAGSPSPRHPARPASLSSCRPAEQHLDRWLADVRHRVAGVLAAFVRDRCAEHVHDVPGAQFVTDLLGEFVAGGKFVRSTFTYLGWLSGAGESEAARRAAASTELLHAFALLQDDVMDRSGLRRGRPAVHRRLADWHRAQGLAGPADHFGESAAILLSDLCLVWAEQLLRDSGLNAPALARGWPRYDTLRGELAVGQFADLVNDARAIPTLNEVLDVTRRKSGNYTVRRPLETPGGRAGRLDADGFRMDTGPTVLTMPDLVAETLAAVGETLAGRLDLIRLDPAYRAQFADGSELDVHTDADAMAEAVACVRRAGRGGRLPAAARVADRALPARVRPVHRGQLRLAAGAGHPGPGPAGGTGRVPPARARDRPVHPRRAAAPGVLLPVAVRRGGPAARAGRLRRHRLHGHGGRGVLPARRDAGAAGRAGRRGGRIGRGQVPLRQPGDRAGAGRVTGPGRAAPTPGSGSPATRWCWRPSWPPPTGCSAGRRGGRWRCGPRRPRWCVHAGAGRRWPGRGAPHDRCSATPGRRRSVRSSPTGQLMSDPSLLVTRPTATDPGLAPDGSDLFYILGARAQPGRADRIDVGRRRDARRAYADRLDRRSWPTGCCPAWTARDPAGDHPGRLGPPGPGRRHAVLLRALVPADRAVPAGQPAARHRQRGAGRVRHRARGRRADRADLRPAGGRPGDRCGGRGRPGARVPRRARAPGRRCHDPRRAGRRLRSGSGAARRLRALPAAERAPRADLLPGDAAAARASGPRCTPCTGSPGWPTTSWTRRRPAPAGPGRGPPRHAVRRPVGRAARRAQRGPAARGGGGHRGALPDRRRPCSTTFMHSMRMDLDGAPATPTAPRWTATCTARPR